MSALMLLQELARRDVQLRIEGDLLKLDAPQGIMTPSLLSQVRWHKQELMIALRSRQAPCATPERPPQSFPAPGTAAINALIAGLPGALRERVEERRAIMVLDGNVPPDQAMAAAIQSVFEAIEPSELEAVISIGWNPRPVLEAAAAGLLTLPPRTWAWLKKNA